MNASPALFCLIDARSRGGRHAAGNHDRAEEESVKKCELFSHVDRMTEIAFCVNRELTLLNFVEFPLDLSERKCDCFIGLDWVRNLSRILGRNRSEGESLS